MKRTSGLLSAALLVAGSAAVLAKETGGAKVYAADPAFGRGSAELEGCRQLGRTEPELEQESGRAANDPYRKQRKAAEGAGGNVLLVFSDVLQRRPSTDCSPSDTSPGCLESSQTWYRTSFGYYACSAEAVARLDAQAKAAPTQGPIFSWTFPRKIQPAPAAATSGSAAPSASPTTATAPPPAAPAAAPPAAPAASANPARAPAASSPSPSPAAVSEPGGPVVELKKKILSMMEAGVGTDVIAAWVSAQSPLPALSADDVIDWKKSGIDEKVLRAALVR
jgi:hypothetical protein